LLGFPQRIKVSIALGKPINTSTVFFQLSWMNTGFLVSSQLRWAKAGKYRPNCQSSTKN